MTRTPPSAHPLDSALIGNRGPSPTKYDFAEPVDTPGISRNDPLLRDLIETPAFQRLKDIRFLGGIDYCLIRSPNGAPASIRYTRYQHSLGVLRLAQLYCRGKSIGLTNRRLICASALLHDVGHPPLSHSLESVFKEMFGIDHHRATEDIILGRVPLGRDVARTLRSHGVDAKEVVAVVSGENQGFDGFFNGPVNFDTIEGVLRSYMYVGRRSMAPNPEAVTRAAMNRTNKNDRNTVDEFWRCKDLIYKKIINSRKGILSDFACRIFMQRHIRCIKLEEDYFGTEDNIFCKLQGLRKLLRSRSFEDDVMQQIRTPVSYQERSYYIDCSGDFFARQDHSRYRHKRHTRTLTCESRAIQTVEATQRDFFDDDL